VTPAAKPAVAKPVALPKPLALPRPVATPKPVAAPQPAAPKPVPAKAPPPGERIGRVTHFFDHVHAGIVLVESGELRVGDRVRFHGHTTDFEQRIDRLELEHAPIQVARAGQEVGVQVAQRVREHDEVRLLARG
jgi:putative protease